MKLFLIPAGTDTKVIRGGKEWFSHNFEAHTTRLDNTFPLEQLIVDPVGKVGASRGGVTVGSAYAEAGYYGFADEAYISSHGRRGFAMLVPGNRVEVL